MGQTGLSSLPVYPLLLPATFLVSYGLVNSVLEQILKPRADKPSAFPLGRCRFGLGPVLQSAWVG